MASKLIHPDNWTGKTYLEILRMLALAAKERVLVLGLSTSTILSWNSNDNKKYDYATYLKYISFNLKMTWSNSAWCGYFKEGLDIGTLALSSTPVDMLWTEADLLADIGDAEFFDFSTSKNNPPVLAKDVCYKEVPYLLQYYNIITRLKSPVINLYYADLYQEYGGWDSGIEAEGVEGALSASGAYQSRHYTLKKEGIGTKGVTGNPADMEYFNWLTGGKTDHDADYALGYVWPTNAGTTKAGTLAELDYIYDNTPKIISGFRAKAQDGFDALTETYNYKAVQRNTYERVKCEFTYSGGLLTNVNGKAQALRWICESSSYAAGDFGNPYVTDKLFFVDQPLTNGVADDIYFGDNTNRPATPPDLSGGGPGAPHGEQYGFTFKTWLTIVEDWDADGGFDYFTLETP